MLSTMCGHGMISHSLAKKMIDFVKENRRTPEQCCRHADAILLLRRVQSRARQADPRRCPHKDDVDGFKRQRDSVWRCWSLSCSGDAASAPKAVRSVSARRRHRDALVFRNFTLIDGGDRAPVPQAAMVVEQGRISGSGRRPISKRPTVRPPTDLNGRLCHSRPDQPARAPRQHRRLRAGQQVPHAREHREGPEDLRVLRCDHGREHGHGPGRDLSGPQRSAGRLRERVGAHGRGGGVLRAAVDGARLHGRPGPDVRGRLWRPGRRQRRRWRLPSRRRPTVNAQLDKGADFIKLWLDSELGTMPKMPPAISTGDHRRGAQAQRARARAHLLPRGRQEYSSTRASTASCTACAISRSIRRSSTAWRSTAPGRWRRRSRARRRCSPTARRRRSRPIRSSRAAYRRRRSS